MGFLLPCLGMVFLGFLLRAYWKSGRIPTVLTFEADRAKNPAAFWVFYSIAALAWCWLVGYLLRGLLHPEAAPRLYQKTRLDWGWWLNATVLSLCICFFAGMELKRFLRRRLIVNIKSAADDASPDEDGWGLEDADLFYRWRELRRLRAELLKMPKGYRRVADAMKRVERDWK